ncbi:ABC transporter permease [Anaerosalibacter massiliensis]|nr:ABC transporter permease [Anaerosalibacter massiliensis]
MILGVVLAIMSVLGFDVINESRSKKQSEMIYKAYGEYHGFYQNLSKDKLEEMKNDKDIEEIAGVASLRDIIAEYGVSIKLNSFNEKYIDMSSYSMKEGHLLEKQGEIVLESQVLKQMGLDEKLNQIIEFKIKKEYKDESGMNQIFMEKKKFKLVGIITKSALYYENFYFLKGFTFFKEGDITVLPKELISYENIVKLKSKSNILSKLNDIRIKYKPGSWILKKTRIDPLILDKNSLIFTIS